ncbi:MAG TPA: hypothetical protein VGG99_08290 [Acetobacteraceae bacterium]|jgi:DNA-binding NarL/FixJ family response regulator
MRRHQTATFDDVVAHLGQNHADLLLLDLQLPALTGATGLACLRGLLPQAAGVVVLADSDDRSVILQCLAGPLCSAG